MKKEKILTLKIAKELLASFLSEKESLPPLPSLPLFGEDAPYWISGAAMPDLTPFTQIETDLDSSLLPLQESIRSIDGYQKWTHIWTHITGKTGHMASRVGETGEEGEIVGAPLIVGSRRSLTRSDEDYEWRDRRDSNPRPPA